jgi:hypothetical protein
MWCSGNLAKPYMGTEWKISSAWVSQLFRQVFWERLQSVSEGDALHPPKVFGKLTYQARFACRNTFMENMKESRFTCTTGDFDSEGPLSFELFSSEIQTQILLMRAMAEEIEPDFIVNPACYFTTIALYRRVPSAEVWQKYQNVLEAIETKGDFLVLRDGKDCRQHQSSTPIVGVQYVWKGCLLTKKSEGQITFLELK